MSLRITRRDLADINERFQSVSPLEILRFAHRVFGRKAAILSGMQRAGSVLCHMADGAGLDLDVVFVDTGVMHAETLATRDELARKHRNLRVITLAPRQSFIEQTREHGLVYLTREGQEQCCDARKSEPLREVAEKYDALVSALRRTEGGARSHIDVFELDPAMGALRVHPFAHLAPADLDAYLREHTDVVMNPLHAMGFRTIGCFPCTTPVRPDESDRAGRWRHLAGVDYCGINPTDRARAPDAFVELDDRYGPLFEIGSATVP